ncbi:MAG: hypothetical protein ACR2J8_07645, partial [Thermomicrobiales bacterium]
RGQPCEKDLNCCSRGGQFLVCVGGVCAPPCVSLGQTCGKDGVGSCCSGSCTVLPTLSSRLFSDSVCCVPLHQSGCARDSDCCQNAGEASCDNGVCSPPD